MLLTAVQREILTQEFRSQIPAIDKCEFIVSFEAMSPEDSPIVITQSEYMRRMKEMAALQPGMSFYGELPDSYSLIVNTEHKLIAQVRDNADKEIANIVSPIIAEIDEKNAQITALREENKDGKMNDENSEKVKSLENDVNQLRAKQNEIISQYAEKQDLVKQLIDLALLGNGLLKGESLSAFIKRSVSML